MTASRQTLIAPTLFFAAFMAAFAWMILQVG